MFESHYLVKVCHFVGSLKHKLFVTDGKLILSKRPSGKLFSKLHCLSFFAFCHVDMSFLCAAARCLESLRYQWRCRSYQQPDTQCFL